MNNLINELKQHVKIHDVEEHKNIITCEIDRIQTISRGIVHRITKKYGKFKINSSTKNVNNLGYTRIIIEKMD